MSRIIEVFKDIRDAKNEISKSQKKMETAEKEIEKWLKNQEFKSFLDNAIIEAMPVDKVSSLREERNKREKKHTYIDPITGEKYDNGPIYVSNVFDPVVDTYSIYSIEEKDNKIKFLIDPHKTRSYLGNAGGWMIDTYTTDWINLEEINNIMDKI